MIIEVNASNTTAKNLSSSLKRLASWGFIVVGNDDTQAGKVFVGENAEILRNSNWQDIEKNN